MVVAAAVVVVVVIPAEVGEEVEVEEVGTAEGAAAGVMGVVVVGVTVEVEAVVAVAVVPRTASAIVEAAHLAASPDGGRTLAAAAVEVEAEGAEV